MKKELRTLTLKKFLPWIIVCFVLAIAGLALSVQGIVCRIAGPVALDTVTCDDSLNGKYVDFEASNIIVACAELSRSSSDDSSSSKLVKTYYLLPTNDGRYMLVVDDKGKNSDVMDKAMDQSYDYYMGDLETLTKLGTLSGTVKPMEDDMSSYITDCITNYTLPGYEEGSDLTALIYPYQIELQKIGFLDATLNVIFLIVGIVFLLIGLGLLIPVLAGAYQKKALSVIYAEHTQEEAEELFRNAAHIENTWTGEYIWYQNGIRSFVYKTEEMVWGYLMPEPLVVSKYRWPVAMYNQDRNLIQFCFMDKKSCQKFIDAVAQQGNPFVSGYTPDLATVFKTDFDSFMENAKKAGAGTES